MNPKPYRSKLYKSAALLIALIFVLCACAEGTEPSAEPQPEPVYPLKISSGDFSVDFYEDEQILGDDLDMRLLSRLYMEEDGSYLLMERAENNSSGYMFYAESLARSSRIGRYDAQAADWVWEQPAEGPVEGSVIAVERAEGGFAIITRPMCYDIIENQSARYYPQLDGIIEITEESYGLQLTVKAAGQHSQVCDFMIYSSDTLELTKDLDNCAKLLEREYRGGECRWLYNAYYSLAPENYEPTGENVYYICHASYTLGSVLERVPYCREAVLYSFAFMDTAARHQNSRGFFPTYSVSGWLKEDYGIGAGFYDTRFNTDLMQDFWYSAQVLGSCPYPGVIDSYLEFYLDYCKNNHTDTPSGGWFVADYGSEGKHRMPHTSLNHQASEALLMYELGDLLGREDLIELADKLRTAIGDGGQSWKRADGDLHYAVFPDGSFGLDDYEYLTYNDLFKLQRYLRQSGRAADYRLTSIMEIKKEWMDRNGIDAYLRDAVNVSESQRLPVLMYHHLTEDQTQVNSVTVTAEKFERDMAWLSSHGYTAVLPAMLAEHEVLPQKPVMITFDDGYASNYELAFPLLGKYGMKAEINVIVRLIDDPAYINFCSWEMLREMSSSGLIEIGSHTYNLHNPDNGGNLYTDGPNGVQRRPFEIDSSFRERVLDDIDLSVSRIEAELGAPVYCFAYPYGARDKYSEGYIEDIFPVTLSTDPGTAMLSLGFYNMRRYGVNMDVELSDILEE